MPLRLSCLRGRTVRRTLTCLTLGVACGGLSAGAAPALPELEQQVAQHLAFGEFERAAQLAGQAGNATDKSKLLGMVAQAQMQQGDFGAALGSIRSMPDYEERRIAKDGYGRESAAAGGGVQANFQPLIDLIMSETNGMWEEVDGSGGTISQFDQGVRVEPSGVLSKVSAVDQAGRLKDLGIQARQALLNDDIAQASDLRVVSLTRLEQAVARALSLGQPVPASARLLGGLTRVTHVFVYPQDGEVVLAGPAEAWHYNANGIPVGSASGRPVLQLDDLVTLVRTFSATGERFFSVSINPRPAGLRDLKDYVESTGSRPLTSDAAVRGFAGELQRKLGRQDFVFTGINPESRVSRIIAEADYRMKLVGVGKYDFQKASRVPSIFDLMTVEEQKSGRLDALRWWLTMKYDAVLHTPDRDGYELVGSSVLCQSENQFLNAQGQQVQTGQSEGANRKFAEAFTTRYDDLAKHDLVFADLKNVFDLALVASILHNEGAARQVGWNYGVFSNEGSYIPVQYQAPREVDSVVAHRTYRGRDVVVQVAGGVRVDLKAVMNSDTVRPGKAVASTAGQAHAKAETPARRWWWDAK